MDRVVAARKLISELVTAKQIEVRRVEIVARDLAKLIETLKRPPTDHELGEWLEEHPQVADLSATTLVLGELIDRHLAEPEAAPTEARNPDLERQLRDATDAGPFQVYADWLQQSADPMGELIALQIAAAGGNDDDVTRFERHLKRHDRYLLGGLSAQLHEKVALRWRHGFVHAIEALERPLDDLPVTLYLGLLKLRVCELVESLTLNGPSSAELDAAIADAAPDSLRALTLVRMGGLPPALLRRPLRALSLQRSHPLEVDAHALPASLETLELRIPKVSSLVPIELSIRELSILASPANVEFVASTKLARLERLTLDLDDGLPVAALEALRLPALTHLGIKNGQLDALTLGAIAKLPIAAQLRSLALVNLGITDDTIAEIAGTRGFTLAEVDVGFNELSRDGLDIARKLAPTVTSVRQLRRGQSMERRVRKLAGTRLQAAEEIADPKAWRRAGIDGEIRWARYRGEAEYELFIAADLSRYGCSCPSTIQPCKHVIALALIAERTPLSPAKSSGIETRVTTRAGLTDLLRASLDE